MNYWFVCQGDTFKQEKGMKYLWAPIKNKLGSSLYHWANMTKVRKGDIIFNYSDGIRGISIAKEDAYSFKNPEQGDRWEDNGTRVDIDFYPLEDVISPTKLKDAIQLLREYIPASGPFDINGRVKQGYLFEFNAAAGDVVRRLYQKAFPSAVDHYFPQLNVVKEDKDIHIAIKTKPFVILAGLSGTGKSRLVRKLAYQFYNIPEKEVVKREVPFNYKLIKVKPNWHDSVEILGYESRIGATDRYIFPEFIKFIIHAWQHPNTPFFLCLDEMNLAPVEQYFAEFLSVIETRSLREDGNIQTDALINAAVFIKYASDDKFGLWNKLEIMDVELQKQLLRDGLTIPSNLIVMGTVNMDETTHAFSRKVLDRAMTIEMNDIQLYKNIEDSDNEMKYLNIPLEPNLLISEKTHGYQVFIELGDVGLRIIKYLKAVNEKLFNTPFRIAYRVRDEFLLYAYNYSKYSNKPDDWVVKVLDEMTMMKILPRIEGDESKTKGLDDLIVFFKEQQLVKSTLKATEMYKRLIKFQHTSFWNY